MMKIFAAWFMTNSLRRKAAARLAQIAAANIGPNPAELERDTTS
jgi:hypothetical protein